jgi:hypothetical protein
VAAAYQFMRLHGYDYDPVGNPLDIVFPVTDPPRKIARVSAGVDVDLFFLNLVDWHTVEVNALGEAESAPLDVYLVLDLSHSMVYDTPRPSWWNDNSVRSQVCPQTGCPVSDCTQDDSASWGRCRAYYCSYEGDLEYPVGTVLEAKARNCDPLDVHIKDSAKFFLDQLDSRYDRVGVIGYDVVGQVHQTLTDDFDAVEDAIDNLDPYLTYGELCTNIGDGILFSNVQMSLPPPSAGGVGGRIDSVWSSVLLTDGRANIYRNCPGCPDLCGGAGCNPQPCSPWTGICADADNWARANAWSSWNLHKIVNYTIAYGDIFFDHPQYRQLMIDIADITDNGVVDGVTENFWAVPDEAGLRQALAEIAERIYTRLVR